MRSNTGGLIMNRKGVEPKENIWVPMKNTRKRDRQKYLVFIISQTWLLLSNNFF